MIYAAPELDSRTLLLTFEALLCSDELPAGTAVRVQQLPTSLGVKRSFECSSPHRR